MQKFIFLYKGRVETLIIMDNAIYLLWYNIIHKVKLII